MKNRSAFYLLLVALLFIYMTSCKKTETPENPYSTVNYSTNNNTIPEPDPNSIAGLHKNIFSKKCALSGCHDGTFEPDFRTIQSSYSSLVYNPVIKNTVDNIGYFSYRVFPGSTTASFLIERLTTSTSDYMPSNGARLQQSYIENIKKWINDGAKDENGNLPVKPNLLPNISSYVIFNTTFTTRYDTNRVGGVSYNAAIVPAATDLNIPFFASDEADSADATPVSSFTNCRIEFSLTKDGFPSLNSSVAFFVTSAQVWVSAVNTSQWPSGTTVYFRIYVNDGQHTVDSEFPRNTSLFYYKSYFSFYVQ